MSRECCSLRRRRAIHVKVECEAMSRGCYIYRSNIPNVIAMAIKEVLLPVAIQQWLLSWQNILCLRLDALVLITLTALKNFTTEVLARFLFLPQWQGKLYLCKASGHGSWNTTVIRFMAWSIGKYSEHSSLVLWFSSWKWLVIDLDDQLARICFMIE